MVILGVFLRITMQTIIMDMKPEYGRERPQETPERIGIHIIRSIPVTIRPVTFMRETTKKLPVI